MRISVAVVVAVVATFSVTAYSLRPEPCPEVADTQERSQALERVLAEREKQQKRKDYRVICTVEYGMGRLDAQAYRECLDEARTIG